MVDQVREIETRERRSDLLVGDEEIFGFFDARVPGDVVTTRHFERWWRDVEDKHQLDLSLGDLIDAAASAPDTEAFPTVWRHGDVEMPLAYEFDPRSPADGMTVEVPLSGLDRVDPSVFEWHVPGMREELVTELVRTLPKKIRKQLVPVTDTVRTVIDRLDPTDGGLLASLRRELSKATGVEIPITAFSIDDLPHHLRPSFRIVDSAGYVVAEGGDLAVLKEALVEDARQVVAASAHPLERDGITEWDFGELAESVRLGEGATSVSAYPALTDEGESVAIRLLATPEERHRAHWAGVRRLVILSLPAPGKLLRALIDEEARQWLRSAPYESVSDWTADCLTAALDEVLAGGLPYDAVGFDALRVRVRDELDERATRVGNLSLEVFEALQAVEVAAARLPERFEYAVADVARQLNQLIYPGFIAALGPERLSDLRRYLLAAEYRLTRIADNPTRDRERMERVHVLERRFEELSDSLPPSDALIAIAWQLQELRVGLFAEKIGTSGTVSEKRILRALADVAIHG